MAQVANDGAGQRAERTGVPRSSLVRVIRRKPIALLRVLGPGLIAGSSDNDPTTVATLAVVGSTTIYPARH